MHQMYLKSYSKSKIIWPGCTAELWSKFGMQVIILSFIQREDGTMARTQLMFLFIETHGLRSFVFISFKYFF